MVPIIRIIGNTRFRFTSTALHQPRLPLSQEGRNLVYSSYPPGKCELIAPMASAMLSIVHLAGPVSPELSPCSILPDAAYILKTVLGDLCADRVWKIPWIHL